MNLDSIRDANGFIKISAMDHRGSLEKILPGGRMSDFKKLLTEHLSKYSTAILVDPENGQSAIEIAKQRNIGILLSREETGYIDSPDGRNTALSATFDSHTLKQMGATAIKILLYYNHNAKNASAQIDIAKKAKEEAVAVDLPLLIEPITYPAEGHPYHKGDAIMRAIQDLRDIADVLKLEFPIDIASSKTEETTEDLSETFDTAIPYLETITMECTQPWILLSRGMQFENYKKALKLSKNAGCAGYAVGRAVWQEINELHTFEEIETFVQTTATQRMEKLFNIFV